MYCKILYCKKKITELTGHNVKLFSTISSYYYNYIFIVTNRDNNDADVNAVMANRQSVITVTRFAPAEASSITDFCFMVTV